MEQARQTLEAQVLERASTDLQFREQLKHDPRETVSRALGVQVPQDITVQVLEETQSKVYLVLPPTPAQRGHTLSDEELETVAGGWSEVTSPACGSCEERCTYSERTCPA